MARSGYSWDIFESTGKKVAGEILVQVPIAVARYRLITGLFCLIRSLAKVSIACMLSVEANLFNKISACADSIGSPASATFRSRSNVNPLSPSITYNAWIAVMELLSSSAIFSNCGRTDLSPRRMSNCWALSRSQPFLLFSNSTNSAAEFLPRFGRSVRLLPVWTTRKMRPALNKVSSFLAAIRSL